MLYLADENKADDAMTEIASLVETGHIVLAPDVRGKGETAGSGTRNGAFATWFSADYKIPMMAFQVNKSLVGMRAQDIVRAVDLISSMPGENSSRVVAVGKGAGTVPLLHAAAFDNRITTLIIEEGPVSWKMVVESRYHRNQLDNVVLGALTAYDLPILAATLAPRPLVLANLVNPAGHLLPVSEVADRYTLATDCYKLLGRPENLVIAERQPGVSLAEAFVNVLNR